ncbi:hypothetical protein AK812_SmicGene9987 [Symbiodinium microadriaticum]|uniref:K Homology domain-containing protein n=1 Tax=Symbiodinium microadriaticum TaxID=2951 RepID=A0A1Q9EH65_SYMMI|nr:hypothetical protein AK812_SmicGene9987 [Symbiodinium microadriaticum]
MAVAHTLWGEEQPLSMKAFLDLGEIPEMGDSPVSKPITTKILASLPGKNLARVEEVTGTNVQLSGACVLFPGTEDRMLVITAPRIGPLLQCIQMVITLMKDLGLQKTFYICKMVVPSSAVSSLLGKGGMHAQEMTRATGCRISVSKRNPNMMERVVVLSAMGIDGLVMGACVVAQRLQANPHLLEHMHFRYETELPRGSWDTHESPWPRDRPLSLGQEDELSKRSLVEHLLRASPREVLLRHRLLGDLRKVLKTKSREQLLLALCDARAMMGCPIEL